MNNKVKIALALLVGGSLVFLSKRRKKNNKLKKFTAPDGNIYRENQIYRTFDNKLYKNGKQIHFDVPEADLQTSAANNFEGNTIENISSYQAQAVNKNVNYHQKGNRHQ
ncbi:hypothetical protein SAMN05421664_0456 [Chryseobacterium soldanellicola]|uniref:Uncharacterized protein n=1 Tax=Chryseobacterium soldanellicola TaxID=311333 RepID=A0A1H0Y3F5_9FLAO|nr:hypothetical protein [Chryseobacterium soldanellicola]SDQ09601.1 hypothetical protein SAMN05421664_0456 [Chryseobacterium soldanellicola]